MELEGQKVQFCPYNTCGGSEWYAFDDYETGSINRACFCDIAYFPGKLSCVDTGMCCWNFLYGENTDHNTTESHIIDELYYRFNGIEEGKFDAISVCTSIGTLSPVTLEPVTSNPGDQDEQSLDMYQITVRSINVISFCPDEGEDASTQDDKPDIVPYVCSPTRIYSSKRIAECHGDHETTAFIPQISCSNTDMVVEQLLEKLEDSNVNLNEWVLNHCDEVAYQVPSTCELAIENMPECYDKIIGNEECRKKTPRNENEKVIRMLCLSHMNLYIHKNRFYKNVFCYLCLHPDEKKDNIPSSLCLSQKETFGLFDPMSDQVFSPSLEIVVDIHGKIQFTRKANMADKRLNKTGVSFSSELIIMCTVAMTIMSLRAV